MEKKTCDVVIVGAGATGLNAALALSEARREVVVVARLPDTSGVLDVDFAELIRRGAEIIMGPVRSATRCAGGYLVTTDLATRVRGRKLVVSDPVDLPGLADPGGRLPAGVWVGTDASEGRAVRAAAAGVRVAVAIEEDLTREDIDAAQPFSIEQERTVGELVQGSRRHGL